MFKDIDELCSYSGKFEYTLGPQTKMESDLWSKQVPCSLSLHCVMYFGCIIYFHWSYFVSTSHGLNTSISRRIKHVSCISLCDIDTDQTSYHNQINSNV